MTRGRGRPPGILLDEAEDIAMKRGEVIMIPGGRSDAFDLILFEIDRNVFVRCRSPVTNIADTLDVLRRYSRDIARMARLPTRKYAAWEFWLRLPRGKWLFFLVSHDSLVEVRPDGTIRYRPVLPVPYAETAAEADFSMEPEEGQDEEGDSPSGDGG